MHRIAPAIALLSLCALPARADTIQLDSGATLTGDLARYEYGGDCQISVTEGPLAGVIAVLPCHRIQSFVRSALAPAPAAGPEPMSAGAPEVPPEVPPEDDPFAAAFADPPPPARADLSWSRPAPEPAPDVSTDPIAAVPAPREVPLSPAPPAADVPEGGASPEERRALSF